jgi:hypothetical protein
VKRRILSAVSQTKRTHGGAIQGFVRIEPSYGDVLLVSSAQISASRLLRTLIIAFKRQAKMGQALAGQEA